MVPLSLMLAMSPEELDEMFTAEVAGVIPDGPMNGTAIIGSHVAESVAKVIRRTGAWKGKTFNAATLTLTNRIWFWNVIVATIYRAPSWYDGRECIVLDYSKSKVADRIRDEIRAVGPDVYLGKVYWGSTPIAHFTLERP